MWSAPSAENAAAANLRRERRLRQWLRHERMTVALVVAESTHHVAPTGQKMARTQEEVEFETHAATATEDSPSRGTRESLRPSTAAAFRREGTAT